MLMEEGGDATINEGKKPIEYYEKTQNLSNPISNKC